MKLLLLMILIIPSLCFPSSENKSFPNVKLKSLKGSEISIKDYRGSYVLVRFWASWCTPCKRGLSVLDEFYMENQSRNIEVLAVSVDAEQSAAKTYLRENPVHFPVVFDLKKELPNTLATESLSAIYLFDPKGKLIHKVDAFPSNKQFYVDLIQQYVE